MKKGYVFTLDAAFAISIIVALLLMTYGYSITSYASGADPVAIKRTASDIVSVLDYNNVLDTLDKNTIESELNQLLPPNLNMSMKLYVYETQYTVECPDSLDDFDFVGCYDYTGTSSCWSGSKAGFVTYPPEENCYSGPPSEDYGGLKFTPSFSSMPVDIGCDDIWAQSGSCESDCDFDDVVAQLNIENTENGVNISLSRLPFSAGHIDSIIVRGNFDGQEVDLEVFNSGEPSYDSAEITCGQEEETEYETIQINNDLTGDYYTGEWKFLTFTGSQIDKYVLVEYKVGLR